MNASGLGQLGGFAGASALGIYNLSSNAPGLSKVLGSKAWIADE